MKTLSLLKEYGWKSLNDLAISVSEHPSLPLKILNYSQLDSPKTNPIVIECRSLILCAETLSVASKAFLRFFNLGEAIEITGQFNWDNYRSYEKPDGSLCHLFFWKNDWLMATRSTFGQITMAEQTFTWADLFWDTLAKTKSFLSEVLDPTYSYIFELCSPYNQNTTIYNEPKLFLLDIIPKNKSSHWFHLWNIDHHNRLLDYKAKQLGVERPKIHNINTKDHQEIKAYVNSFNNQDEGIVCQDNTGLRIKVKNLGWLAINRLSNNGNFFYKDLYDALLKEGDSETILYYPHTKKKFDKLRETINVTKEKLLLVWDKVRHIEDQKEFALALMAEKVHMSWVLFECRRHNISIDDIFTVQSQYYNKIKKSILELL